MKNLITLVATLLVATATLVAQNFDAPYNLSHFNGLSVYSNRTLTLNINFGDTTVFAPLNQLNRFMLGWQWTSQMNLLMNKRLHTNFQPASWHGWKTGALKSTPDNTTMNWKWTPHTIAGWDWLGQSYEWRPCAPLQDTTELFVPLQGDTTGAIFGFRHKPFGTADVTLGSPTFMNWKLNHDSTKTYPLLALSRAYNNTFYFGFNRKSNARSIPDSILGTTSELIHDANRHGNRWYLTIHCRNTSNTFSNLPLSDTILSMRVRSLS